MLRAQFDLKADAGRDAFLRLAASADVVIESFRPGVVDRLGIGYSAVQAVNPGVVYCSTTGYGQDGPYSQWAGHDINYLAVGGYLDCSGRDEHGGPALPGATIGDGAGGGMHAVIAILAALVHRAATGDGHLPRRLGRRRRALAHVAAPRRVPRDRRGARAAPRPPHRPVRLLRRLPGAGRRVARRGRDRTAVLGEPVPGARVRPVDRAPARRRGAGPDPRRSPRGLRDPGPRRVGRDARAREHVRLPRRVRSRGRRRRALRRARHVLRRRTTPSTASSASSAACSPA